jgi:4-hydroxybenzoate polyprenyltransferase
LAPDDKEEVMEALKQLFWSSRPVSWINTAFPFGATYVFINHKVDLTFVVGTLFFLIPYNFLIYGINDVFDYESDLRNPRKGGIEGALLNKKWHKLTLWSSTLLCVPFLAYLYLVSNVSSALWLTFFIFTVVAYSAPKLRFKERGFLDSLTASSHFVGPMIYALSLSEVDLAQRPVLSSILAFTLWGIASHAFGAVQDVKADREADISSIATLIGAKATVWFAFIAYALAGVLVMNTIWPGPIAAIAAVPYLLILTPYLNITDEDCERANKGWRRFIWLNFFAGFVVSLILISSALFN